MKITVENIDSLDFDKVEIIGNDEKYGKVIVYGKNGNTKQVDVYTKGFLESCKYFISEISEEI